MTFFQLMARAGRKKASRKKDLVRMLKRRSNAAGVQRGTRGRAEPEVVHLADFALAAARPVAVVDRGDVQSRKVNRNLSRAGRADIMTDVPDLPARAQAMLPAAVDASEREARAVCTHLDRLASTVGA